ncbi:RxLR effector candidate protein [Plasmodiophora brassicae]|nr:hypothetical protein PBRA_003066 [Plasmodiophora brassicae]
MSTSFSDVVLVLTVLGMITSGSAMIHLAGNNAQGYLPGNASVNEQDLQQPQPPVRQNAAIDLFNTDDGSSSSTGSANQENVQQPPPLVHQNAATNLFDEQFNRQDSGIGL